jgi:hypothetical protein
VEIANCLNGAQEEVDALVRELERATDRRGRPRRSASGAERARVNVTRAIRTAVRAIAREDTELGSQLGTAIHTGTFCCYRP